MCIPYIWSLTLPAYQQMEKKKQENKMRRDQLNDEYLELLEKQRLYFKTVKEFKEVRTLLLYSTVMSSDSFCINILICLSHHVRDASWLLSPCESWTEFDSGSSSLPDWHLSMLQGEVIKQVVYLGFQVESLEDLWAVRYGSKEGCGNVCE